MSRRSGIFSAAILLVLVSVSARGADDSATNALDVAARLEAEVAESPAKRDVAAGELVKLYAEAGDSEKALSWARVVMEKNPDPQAYLAGVYGLLGKWVEAKAILKKELAGASDAHRQVVLNWQLADVCEKSGDLSAAEQALNDALKAAQGLPAAALAEQRLTSFRERRGNE